MQRLRAQEVHLRSGSWEATCMKRTRGGFCPSRRGGPLPHVGVFLSQDKPFISQKIKFYPCQFSQVRIHESAMFCLLRVTRTPAFPPRRGLRPSAHGQPLFGRGGKGASRAAANGTGQSTAPAAPFPSPRFSRSLSRYTPLTRLLRHEDTL